ncbi:Phosphoribosylamine--glycine ligase [Thioalkalivibrio nitratireducens DSM 14787]|uniref:Phosphoribosylamine--glycine ligase n=1 Tax=Thioalkalivibrio nitratireducens (strain DSM 14787 / UNIQEM 213 / ALEN2) TaxID=1255043 RepID=L0DSG7_THIND|nr:phosphoribosylamine--glycine ligase [Thioalkalivibrio nitratireducens]AGA31943.1 Phosphoribosylamine--glycine ligase [Thioalkalivibrio nitratireducens DSM 14787]
MNVLVVGGGGREHALAWKLAQSPRVNRVLVAPGNAGTAAEPKCENVAIAATDIDALAALAQREGVAFTVVGPEAPLVDGIVDTFRARRLRIFGPSAKAAQLEGSKAFAKDFMQRHGIPTAAYGSFTNVAQAEAFIHAHGAPIVVKADGLAAGKGVILAQTVDEALAAARDMLAGNAFGAAGHRVVIEEFLTGEEASFICMIDGDHILPLASSQDHKARDDGDLGPNTGGMGAYSPAPVVTPELHRRIVDAIVEPTLRGMAAEGERYTGFLYAGVMIDPQGHPKVLEFNCRFGDPETQPILMRLTSDLADLVEAAIDGHLNRCTIDWDPRVALGVVLAAGGYPCEYRKGDEITGLDTIDRDTAKVFHAGTRLRDDGRVLTDGGRVLCVVGLGDDFRSARDHAYRASQNIRFKGIYYRTDIGHRALERTP